MSALALKLIEIMESVERIPKNGWNNFHNYAYATEADIADALRSELSSRKVLLLPSVTGSERDFVGDKGRVLTHLAMEFTFMDAETGETITRQWFGSGTDSEDKGTYKAMTGGEKYFLLKTFLVPTGDDPEAGEGEGQQPPGNRATGQQRPPQAPPKRQAPTPPQGAASSGGLRVTEARVAKTGKNAKGPWAFHVVKFSDGREGTTFSTTLYGKALGAYNNGLAVDVHLDRKGDIVSLEPVRG